MPRCVRRVADYDCAADPHEWINLAAKPEHRGTLTQLRLHLPKVNAVDAPVRASGR